MLVCIRPGQDLAKANSSEHYIAKAVTELTKLGLVDSQRGRTGVIFLTERGRSATVGNIVRGLEGATEVVDCIADHPCPLAATCRLRRILADAQEMFHQELDKYALSELVSPHAVQLLHLPALSMIGAATAPAGACHTRNSHAHSTMRRCHRWSRRVRDFIPRTGSHRSPIPPLIRAAVGRDRTVSTGDKFHTISRN